jgi:hypothetical protein
MRISRGCYDKFHRCPGWAGGGFRSAKVDRCSAGRIQIRYDATLWWLRTWRCNECDVVVLPHATRWLDPTWLGWWIRWKLRDAWDWYRSDELTGELVMRLIRQRRAYWRARVSSVLPNVKEE